MIAIRSSRDLQRAFDGLLEIELRQLLTLRRDQLMGDGGGDLGEHVHFIIVRPSDTLAAIEAEAGFPLTGESAPFEWVQRHGSGWIEAPVITDDEGFAVVILARDCIATDPALLSALRAHA